MLGLYRHCTGIMEKNTVGGFKVLGSGLGHRQGLAFRALGFGSRVCSSGFRT